MNQRRICLNVLKSSPSSTTSRQNAPWIRAFCADRAFPSSVRGPVDLRALRRFARAFLSEIFDFDAATMVKPSALKK
jgi:hypothetical protein